MMMTITAHTYQALYKDADTPNPIVQMWPIDGNINAALRIGEHVLDRAAVEELMLCLRHWVRDGVLQPLTRLDVDHDSVAAPIS